MTNALPAVLLLALGCAAATLPAQDAASPDEREVLGAIERLSAATSPQGTGVDAYAAMLADDFSRWTVGSETIEDKASWVEGVRRWWVEGWRVAHRDTELLELVVRGEHAFTRRVVTETYAGPDGERSTSTAALAEVWVRDGDAWLLLRVDVRPVDPAAS